MGKGQAGGTHGWVQEWRGDGRPGGKHLHGDLSGPLAGGSPVLGPGLTLEMARGPR